MEIFIYTLNHPTTNEIKYVGKTNNPKRRLYHHIEESKRKNGFKNRHVINWINHLLLEKLKPTMNIIEICNEDNWEEREKYWIKYYKGSDVQLCNIESGGKHCIKNFSDETKLIHANNLRALKSKYSEQQKEFIWNLICEKYSDKEIMNIFPEISKPFLYQIKNGYKWNHITKLTKPKSTIDRASQRRNTGKGYFYSKQISKYIAVVAINKKKHILGKFQNESDAIIFVRNYRNNL